MVRLTDIYGDMDGLRSAADRADEMERRASMAKVSAAQEAPEEATIKGPYQYPGEQHPCFRIDAADRYVGSIAIHDGDEATAYEIAEAVVAALARQAA